ncbi:SDR family NAD(P)-dependent oxidoreductase [Rheinheimera sp. YQF-2]|uniref:SDR family NAD(P)-dependent oxidoreductase n=1 Tax=Rheinheimera lutimaris TaxID=2740584 RepID=A0A7Y5ATY4_9GAMM|nr:SDR family NAD(P)-dependent oxidoreductase [Rheinheimera lutimaris]NRQ43895.1 SDR family NAD(P)-dependent oxidoreductase [Rheinheimera lutimaris]
MNLAVLIIGAGSGIGQALVQHYLQQHYVVHALSRSASPLPVANDKLHWHIDNTADTTADNAHRAGLLAQIFSSDVSCIFICNGVLHDDTAMPEKTIRQLESQVLQARLHSNVVVPAMYLQQLFPYLCKSKDVRVLVLSAKVGSITDNRLGGWYSYRISKAALNMLVKNISIEVGRLNKTAAVVSVHPGTTDTALSQPFQANLPAGQLQSTAATALRLAQVAAGLQPEQSGALLNWDGTELPF